MINVTIKEQEYILNLDVKAITRAEDRLGCNLLDIYLGVENNQLPKIKDLLVIFHESLVRYQHGIKFDDVYQLYDDYIHDGHKFPDFVVLITDIFKDAGIIPDQEEEEATEESKN